MQFIATLDEAFEFISPEEAERACVITDPRHPDNPIMYATPAFERRTGYSRAELLGRNCRLLQGAATDKAEVARIRRALWEMMPVTSVLLNYRKDGSPFLNAFSIRPSFGVAGDLRSFVSIHGDVEDFEVSSSETPWRWSEALRFVPGLLTMPGTGISSRR